MQQKNEKRTLTAALSTTLPYAVIEMKPVPTRSNSNNTPVVQLGQKNLPEEVLP